MAVGRASEPGPRRPGQRFGLAAVESLPDALHAFDNGVLPIPRATLPEPERVHILDSLIGLWAVGRQLAAAVEARLIDGAEAPRVTRPPDVGSTRRPAP